MRDALPAFAHEPSDAQPSPAPVRASLFALFARLGAPGGWRARTGDDVEPLADAFEFDAAPPNASQVFAPATASRAQNRLRRMRDEARAAYAAIAGSHDAALDAALAVVEAKLSVAARERDRYGEALKAIRLYAPDADSRQRARRAIEARRGAPCACGGRNDA